MRISASKQSCPQRKRARQGTAEEAARGGRFECIAALLVQDDLHAHALVDGDGLNLAHALDLARVAVDKLDAGHGGLEDDRALARRGGSVSSAERRRRRRACCIDARGRTFLQPSRAMLLIFFSMKMTESVHL